VDVNLDDYEVLCYKEEGHAGEWGEPDPNPVLRDALEASLRTHAAEQDVRGQKGTVKQRRVNSSRQAFAPGFLVGKSLSGEGGPHASKKGKPISRGVCRQVQVDSTLR
jgi:hypothetical protein